MHFFRNHKQSLPLEEGAIIRANYLYDINIPHINEDQANNLIWVFYLIPTEYDKKAQIPILIQVTWEKTYEQKGYFVLQILEFSAEKKMLVLEPKKEIQKAISTAKILFEEPIDNRFFLFFKLKHLSNDLLLTLENINETKRRLDEFKRYNDSTLYYFRRSVEDLFKFFQKRIRQNPYEEVDYIEEFFSMRRFIDFREDLLQMKHRKYILDFYVYQKNKAMWYEFYLWMQSRINKYREEYVKSIIIRDLLVHKSIIQHV